MTRPRPVKRLMEKVVEAGRQHRERHRPTGFGFAIADRVAFLDAGQWDRVTAGASVFLSRQYLQTLEDTAPQNLEPRYAMIYRGREPVACSVCQLVRIAASRVVKSAAASGRSGDSRGKGLLRGAIGRLQRGIGSRALGLVRARVLTCGNLLSWGPHGVAFAPGEDEAAIWPAVAEVLYRIRRAERLGGQTDLVLVKDVPDAAWEKSRPLERFSFRSLATDPNMVLEILPAWRSYDDYASSLVSKYRKSARQIIESVETAGCRVERLADIDRHADRLHSLYLQVHERAAVRPVTISPRYMPALAAAFGDALRCTVVRRDDEILGFVTTFRDGDTAVAYLIGLDYAVNAGIPIYLRLLHAVVADAIALGCRNLSLGRTALEPKARLGARPEPLRIWVRHRQPVLNLLVRSLLGAIPHGEAPERNPFQA